MDPQLWGVHPLAISPDGRKGFVAEAKFPKIWGEDPICAERMDAATVIALWQSIRG
jgi:hypothetical protein